MLEHHLDHFGEVVGEERGQRLRCHALGHAGKAAHVAEEHGDLAPLTAQACRARVARDLGGDTGREVALEAAADDRLLLGYRPACWHGSRRQRSAECDEERRSSSLKELVAVTLST